MYEKLEDLKIDKSSGVDDINHRILRKNNEELLDILCQLYNLFVNIRALSDNWKACIVIALRKKGSKSYVNNYRPISLTSVVCKVLE